VGVEGSSVTPSELVTCNGKVFFVLANTLWESDGTKKGTHPVEDNIFSTVNIQSYSNSLTAAGNKLFLTLTHYKYGQELYSATISKEGIVNYVTASDGNWNNPSTWADNMVPPEGASVIIKHNITGNINAICNGISVAPTGRLTVNSGIAIKILQ
jgi:hypothetical protein